MQATRAESHAAGVIDGQKQEREEGMKKLVKSLKKCSLSMEEVALELAEQYELTGESSLEKAKQYWN